jgi:hypothetical protein
MGARIELSPAEQQQIQQWVAAHGTPQQVAKRCQTHGTTIRNHLSGLQPYNLRIHRKTLSLPANSGAIQPGCSIPKSRKRAKLNA